MPLLQRVELVSKTDKTPLVLGFDRRFAFLDICQHHCVCAIAEELQWKYSLVFCYRTFGRKPYNALFSSENCWKIYCEIEEIRVELKYYIDIVGIRVSINEENTG